MLVLTAVYQLNQNKKWMMKKCVSAPGPDPDPSPDPDPGVGVNVGDDSSPNSGVNDDNKPAGLDNSFIPDGYWGINAHSTSEYVLNTIASFTNFEPSKSSPQYGFNRGMKEFGELGFDATMKELTIPRGSNCKHAPPSCIT
jgi:hypothetical protein